MTGRTTETPLAAGAAAERVGAVLGEVHELSFALQGMTNGTASDGPPRCSYAERALATGLTQAATRLHVRGIETAGAQPSCDELTDTPEGAPLGHGLLERLTGWPADLVTCLTGRVRALARCIELAARSGDVEPHEVTTALWALQGDLQVLEAVCERVGPAAAP